MKQLVIDSLKWLTIARLLSQLTRWAVTFLVIQRLSPEDFGLAALAQSVLNLLELFTHFGLNAALVQSRSVDRRMLQVIFGMIVLINLGLASLLWVAAPVVADYYAKPELVEILRVLCLTFVLSVVSSLPSAMLVRDMRFRVIALSQVLSGFSGAAVSLYLAYTGFGYWALVWGGLTILAVDSLVRILACPTWVLPIINFREVRPYFTFGSLVMGSVLVRYLYTNLDVIIAGKVWTAETLGIYAVALQLAVLPLNKMMPMVRQVAFPAYSRNQEDEEKVRSYLIKSMALAMALTFPLFFGLGSVAILFVPVLLGEAWEAASLPILILCLVVPFRMLLELFEPPLNATGNPGVVLLNSVGVLLVMVPTFLISVNWQVVGLAMGWLLVFPILTMLSCAWYCKVFALRFSRLLQAIWAPIFSSLVMLAVVSGSIVLLRGTLADALLLAVAILSGVSVYTALIYVVDRDLYRQYRSLIFRSAS